MPNKHYLPSTSKSLRYHTNGDMTRIQPTSQKVRTCNECAYTVVRSRRTGVLFCRGLGVGWLLPFVLFRVRWCAAATGTGRPSVRLEVEGAFLCTMAIGHVPCDVHARFPPTHGGHVLFHEPFLEVRGRYLFVYKPFLSVVTLELLVGSQKNQLC